jgi:hypothetical protein
MTRRAIVSLALFPWTFLQETSSHGGKEDEARFNDDWMYRYDGKRKRRKLMWRLLLAYPSMFIVFILTINLLCNALGHAGYANAKYW